MFQLIGTATKGDTCSFSAAVIYYKNRKAFLLLKRVFPDKVANFSVEVMVHLSGGWGMHIRVNDSTSRPMGGLR